MHSYLILCSLASLGKAGAIIRESPYGHLPLCKVAPTDDLWPTQQDWSKLNASIDSVLISTRPAASSCYPGNPFGSTEVCDEVIENWGFSAFHGSLPESIDYPIWANNSCLPPNATGYDESTGCSIGGYPQYIANVTTAEQVAVALRWASERNVRVVVKGTGHDLNGRSAGAFSLSIWTHNLKQRSVNNSWPVPASNKTASVLIAGSGNTWGEALGFALDHSRAVVSGVDMTVGLGGFIQGGGHGPLSSTYGLAADQLLQVTIVTSTGLVLVANDAQNQDLFWAIRGGGGGQYGVVTEYVMLTYPAPIDIVASNVGISAANLTTDDPVMANATWTALAQFMSSLPDLMDQGVVGSGSVFTGDSARRNLGLSQTPPGIVASLSLWSYNSTHQSLGDLLAPLKENVLKSLGNASSLISMTISEPSTTPNYTAFFNAINASPSVAGQISLSSSRLLGRSELSELPQADLGLYLRRIMASQTEGAGSFLTIGLQGGLGPRNVAHERRGAVNPIWRKAYVHMIATGADTDLEGRSPGQFLDEAAEWVETNKENVWREWAPETGAYMNEANPFNGQWKHDFYGTSYDSLVQIKRKISKRERYGRKSDVILSGIKLRPETVSKETWRNGPLPILQLNQICKPRLQQDQTSPSPRPPSDLSLVVCSPSPMNIKVNWPETLPWIEFQTKFRGHECENFGGRSFDSSSLASLLPIHISDIVSIARRLTTAYPMKSRLVSNAIWDQQYLSKISAHIGLVIPELWEGENLVRAEVLVAGSGFEQLRHILEIFIATLSNNIHQWEDIEANWNILKYLLEFFRSNSSHNILESRTMMAFSDNLFHSFERSEAVSVLQRAVEFGDRFEHIVSLLIEFGAQIDAGDDDGGFSALRLVLDEHSMKHKTGSNPRVRILQRILIEEALKDPNIKRYKILAEHAIRHGNKDLLEHLSREGFNMEFYGQEEYGLSFKITPITCAAQFCPTPQEGPWDEWLSFVLNLMPLNKQCINDWPLIDPLVCAAGAGNNDAVRYLWGLVGNLDVENEDGIFPLLAAAARGQIDTCELLISLGADGNKASVHGLSAIHAAAIANHYEIIQFLAKTTRDKGARLYVGSSSQVILTRLSLEFEPRPGAYSVLDIVMNKYHKESIKHLIRNGFCLSAFGLRKLIDTRKGASLILSRETDLISILAETHLGENSPASSETEHINLKGLIRWCAIRIGCRSVLEKYFKDDWEVQGDEILSALLEGDIEATISILSLGVDLKSKQPKYVSFLEAAISSGDQETINWAFAADPGYYDPGALCAAVELAFWEEPVLCYREVLARRPKNLAADILESTAVGIAAEGDNLQLLQDLLFVIPPSPHCLMDEDRIFGHLDIKILLPHYRCLLDEMSRYRCRHSTKILLPSQHRCRPTDLRSLYLTDGSPLTYAVGVGREEHFSLMRESGYQPDESTLFRAITIGSLEQIKLIYGSGLDALIDEGRPDHYTLHQRVPFTIASLVQTAAYKNRTDVVQWLLTQHSTVKEWTVNAMLPQSALQCAVKHGNLELVNILLKHGASPNEKPANVSDGMTALQLAAANGYIGIAKILIDHESPADVNAHRQPLEGMTALEAASRGGHLDMVQFLLHSGAKTEGTGQRQYIRAIKFAQNNGFPEIVNILKEYRQWTQYDEEYLRNEDVWEDADVHESEYSNSECDLPHEWHDSDDDSEDDSEDGGEDGDEDDDGDDGEVFLLDKNSAQEENAITSLNSISMSWKEVMTLEEAEEAFLSYGED
ncbi:hypothetical protein GQX73_g5906 [Xylaria multiplex]|uniref:FAD-binding PCMH-type domain-containing protein n=1 Tax=Xylaria multiplex TaxID=323545 RepID=A0A7C8IS28_9PEZI|nr:hypothetical protein GQX73_g5906 [Xylaria multiplex]